MGKLRTGKRKLSIDVLYKAPANRPLGLADLFAADGRISRSRSPLLPLRP
ncbi:hypothetical protein GW17_00035940 [Ensete ventricosum]|nr:hypothetical protein GW17_00035940 [Ensete ventricosum]